MLLLAVIEELAGSHLCHLTKIFSQLKGKAILPGISFPTTSQPSSFRTMWMLSSFPAGKSLFWLVLSALQLYKINGDVPGGLPECFPNSTNATVYRFLPPNRHHFLTSRPRSTPLLLSVSRLDKHKHTRVEPSCSLKDLHPAVFIHLNTLPVGQWEKISLLLYIFLGLLVFYWFSLLMWLFLRSNSSRIILAIAMSVHYCDPVSHSFSVVLYKVKKNKYC